MNRRCSQEKSSLPDLFCGTQYSNQRHDQGTEKSERRDSLDQPVFPGEQRVWHEKGVSSSLIVTVGKRGDRPSTVVSGVESVLSSTASCLRSADADVSFE